MTFRSYGGEEDRGVREIEGVGEVPVRTFILAAMEVETSWPGSRLICISHILHTHPPPPGPAARGTAYAGGLQN